MIDVFLFIRWLLLIIVLFTCIISFLFVFLFILKNKYKNRIDMQDWARMDWGILIRESPISEITNLTSNIKEIKGRFS